MPGISALLTFVIALFFLEITPGPDMMLVLARGIGQGRKTALLTVVGMVFIAGIVQVSFLVLGLSSLVQAYPHALIVLRWFGAGYLFYLGMRMMRASLTSGQTKLATQASSSWQAMREGTINSLTNPKSLLFMFAFLPQFVDPSTGPVWTQLLILGSIQKLAGIASLGSVALAAGTVGEWFQRWPHFQLWQRRFTGLVMVGLGIRLLLASDVPGFNKALGAR